MTRIYIAHPYTGDEEKNREHAIKVEELLREATPNVSFYNPVGRLSEQFKALPYLEVMDRCLAELASCDGVVFCGAWENSTGCRMEVRRARELQLPRWYGVVAYVKSWTQVANEAAQVVAAEMNKGALA